MRKINTRDFRIATRTTSRDINRRIALNVIREHQPISRADLARHLNLTRGVVSTLVPELIKYLSVRIRRMLKTHSAKATCEGIGVVIPGMVDQRTGQILNAPALGWRGVDIRTKLAGATGLPVHIENSGRACALAQLWLEKAETAGQSFVYVSVSDGVGTGIVMNGELIRGRDHIVD